MIRPFALAIALAWPALVTAQEDHARAVLKATYPDVAVARLGHAIRVISGTPMTPGATPFEAAAAFLAAHGEAIGGRGSDLTLDWQAEAALGRFTVFQFAQSFDGVPVEYGIATVVVHNALNRVIHAAGVLAERPAAMAPTITPDEAIEAALAASGERRTRIEITGGPDLVVFFGETTKGPSALAWRVQGRGAINEAWTWFIDARTARLMHVRSDVVHADIVGHALGFATPGLLPDVPSNPPTLMPMPSLRVDHVGGGSAYTSESGAFTIPFAGMGPVDVETSLANGLWASVSTGLGALGGASASAASAAVPIDLTINATPDEIGTAQTNALIHVTKVHDYVKERAPTFTLIDHAIPTRTNLDFTCNAFFSGQDDSINFYRSSANCANSAFSTVIVHEYGHYMIDQRNVAQGAFGEGFADTIANFLFDDRIVGHEFFTPGTSIRDPLLTNVPYPCPGAQVHFCGQMLSGIWWRIRDGFQAKYGPTIGLEMARQLHVDWYLVTVGGNGDNAAHGITIREVLTVDDDDGILSNGTPNAAEIIAAFADHGIRSDMTFEFPFGRPEYVEPDQPAVFFADVVNITSKLDHQQGKITYAIGGGPDVTTPILPVGQSGYVIELPPLNCGQEIRYYFTIRDTLGNDVFDPPGAPAERYLTTAGNAITVVDEQFFSKPTFWTVSGTAVTSGEWEWGHPGSSALGPPIDYDGTARCFATGILKEIGGATNDVDGGPTVLTSESYDLSPYSLAKVSFARWIRSQGGTPDELMFEVSTDGGAHWTLVESASDQQAWNVTEFEIPFPTAATMFRWSIADFPDDSETEAAIDAFRVVGLNCQTKCYADCDRDGSLTLFDFLCFVGAFNSFQIYADCDHDSTFTLFDFLCFVAEFNAGCP